MSLLTGAKLGPYEIVAPVGAGGMGEVYRARDPRLGRDIAIKVSHERFSERFEREARAIAALNHPNICQIYDVGDNYLVMEFVEGAPIARPDSTRKLLDQAVQIADGLSAAHAAGIVHRDLKPANILITGAPSGDPGRVKILDFGLAKSAADDSAQDATRTIGITDPGATVGTIAYMSPEQARGQKRLAPQSDQFSLGLVLYELCAGKPAFVRGSSAETMTAIIREEAEPLPATVPAPLRWVIERLLAKEPADRYDSTRDLYRELRHIRDRITETTSAREVPAAKAAKPRRRRPIIAVSTAAGLIGGLAIAAWLTPAAQPDLSKYQFTPVARDEAPEINPKWSPDGKSIAYNAIIHGINQVFTKVVGSAETVQLTHCVKQCFLNFWSRDGATIYYVSDNSLWSVAASGGAPERVLDNVTRAILHPDGHTIFFVRDGKLWIASLAGSGAREMSWQPPRKSVLWAGVSPDASKLGMVDGRDLWILPLPSGPARKVFSSGFEWQGADWLPDSRQLLTLGSFKNTSTLELLDSKSGSRRTIYASPDALMSASVSSDGKRIAYSTGTYEWDIVEVTLATGAVHTTSSGGGVSWWPDWSPSGTHYLVSSNRSGAFSIQDVGTSGFSRVLAEASKESRSTTYEARMAPDGSRFVFTLFDEAAVTSKLMLSNASGGPAIAIADLGAVGGLVYSWSPDSLWIAAVASGPKGKQQVVRIRATAGATPIPLTKADLDLAGYDGPEWSPAGDWILYPSKEGMSLISPDGARVRKLSPHKLSAYGFSKDGRTVYGLFHNTATAGAEWQLYAIDVSTGAEKVLAPVDLPASANAVAGFSLHPDSKRFLTSIAKWQYDIWMIEGFDQQPANWLSRIWRQ
ncbi:MAG TPA: protein kinase [Verrucomicrobiae bacterium]|nr:protein kinase [Verrucomicrobiae bacterium]